MLETAKNGQLRRTPSKVHPCRLKCCGCAGLAVDVEAMRAEEEALEAEQRKRDEDARGRSLEK